MRERDYNSPEDYRQYTRYLIEVKNKTTYQVVSYIERLKKGFRRRYKQLYKKPLASSGKLNDSRSDLEVIIFPDHLSLEAMPIYHRYIAWCLQKTNMEAVKILGTNRMTLYRFLKKVGYGMKSKPKKKKPKKPGY
jgi:hypothetical protein